MQMRGGNYGYLKRIKMAIEGGRVLNVLRKDEWIWLLLLLVYGVAMLWLARALGVSGATLA